MESLWRNSSAYLKNLESLYPYRFAFTISSVLLITVLFTPPFLRNKDNEDFFEPFEMIDADKLILPKRATSKSIDPLSDKIDDQPVVDKSTGESDNEDAVDLAFYPDVIPPRPIGSLKKIYPELARQMEMEAVVYLRLSIGINGNVTNIAFFGVKLSKPVPDENSERLKLLFMEAAKEILIEARFTPSVIEGEKRAVTIDMPLRFTLR